MIQSNVLPEAQMLGPGTMRHIRESDKLLYICKDYLLIMKCFLNLSLLHFTEKIWDTFFFLFFVGESTNAVPHYHKLCSQVSHIWGNRRGQHIRSAMDKPRPGKSTFVIMVSPLLGKYKGHILNYLFWNNINIMKSWKSSSKNSCITSLEFVSLLSHLFSWTISEQAVSIMRIS